MGFNMEIKRSQWKRIGDGGGGHGGMWRLMVPGGWLVEIAQDDTVSVTFMPDPHWEWNERFQATYHDVTKGVDEK